jgi:DNA-binding response OmpR family regulator/signal transduction histidine kinase
MKPENNASGMNVLMVDDDKKLCRLVRDYLSPMGYEVAAAHTGPEGLEMAMTGGFHVMILDVMMPGMDGFEVLKRLRQESDLPVLMLTARGDETDRIVGLELGADDYLPKTFSTRELLARLRAVTRRYTKSDRPEAISSSDEMLLSGGLEINQESRTARIGGQLLALTPIEFDLLLCLAKAAGRVLSRDQLLDAVVGRSYEVFDRSIDVHISSLRRKLGDSMRNGPMNRPMGDAFGAREPRGDEYRPFKPNDLPGGNPHMMMRTTNPTRYWAQMIIPLHPSPTRSGPPSIALLLAVSDSITGNGFFFDPFPWIITAVAVLLLSVLLWMPLAKNITRPIARMTRAAEEIAKGKFEVRIEEHRADEIGRLGSAINHMTTRLSGFLKGQKRFLGDVAHELGSPIARIQLGLGILEQRVSADNQQRVADVMEDVAHMSNLVNELLSFSKAEMNHPVRTKLTSTGLLPLVQGVVEREGTSKTQILLQIESDIQVMASPELLARALSNLIRNAVRYAGNAGAVFLKAERKKDLVIIEIKDSGPGVAEELLDQIFEPFYRPEPSRDRNSGGVGLGLAIVKTCIAACNGTVAARNASPSGLAVEITLKA